MISATPGKRLVPSDVILLASSSLLRTMRIDTPATAGVASVGSVAGVAGVQSICGIAGMAGMAGTASMSGLSGTPVAGGLSGSLHTPLRQGEAAGPPPDRLRHRAR